MKTPKKKSSAPARPQSALPAGSESFRKWRDQLNPLRGLTIKKAVTLLDEAQRGIHSNFQWTCRLVERRFPELSALIARRASALREMDWDIKTVAADDADEGLKTLAEEQAKYLRGIYEGVGNLYEAIDALAMAVFRGFAFLEKIVNADGDLVELRPVDPWNLVQDGQLPRWKYNPDARTMDFNGIAGDELPLERFVVRQAARPLNELALVLFIRQGLALKDRDAFIEIYGVPGGIVTLPPDVPSDRLEEYQAAAKAVAEGGSGALPHGSSYAANDGPRGTDPFEAHLKHIAEQIILAGTGGKLTMLAESGSGTLAGSAHADAFEQIARADAREINELFQRGIDAEALAAQFPGQPHLAYFEINFRESVDANEVADLVAKLADAGLQADPDEVGEKLGMKLTLRTQARAQTETTLRVRESSRAEAVANRAAPRGGFLSRAADLLAGARRADFTPIAARLRDALAAPDDAIAAALAALVSDLPSLLPTGDSEGVKQWTSILHTALAEGGATPPGAALSNGNSHHDRRGRFAFAPDTGGGGGGGNPPAPRRISTEEADALLAKGFSETDSQGRAVHFGDRLKEHIEIDAHHPSDVKGRKEHLEWAREAVRSGNAVDAQHKGELRRHYVKLFEHDGKDKGFFTVVDIKDGEAFSIFRVPVRVAKKMGNKKYQSEEQPPGYVLQAITAAGGSEDWLELTPSWQGVKP
jgi:phage gp29-like protein